MNLSNMLKPFKKPCPNCGKETITFNPNKKSYCSRECETNDKYKNKFMDDRYWRNTPVKEK